MNLSPCKQEGARTLLVEGLNDCHVILALCNYYKIPETFGIYECGSDNKILKRLNALICQPEPPETIGIVIDADNPDLTSRWRAIQQKLNQYSYQFPAQPLHKGTIIRSDDLPTIGFWLMPDNIQTGMLEDFCYQLAKPECRTFAEKCVHKAGKAKFSTFKPSHKSKAIIHTYLAWQDEPGRPLGQAITALSLHPETAVARDFVNWLKKLFI